VALIASAFALNTGKTTTHSAGKEEISESEKVNFMKSVGMMMKHHVTNSLRWSSASQFRE